jgi:hypothetical protein
VAPPFLGYFFMASSLCQNFLIFIGNFFILFNCLVLKKFGKGRLLTEFPEQVKGLYIPVRINTVIQISNTHEYNIYGITLVLKVFGSFIK